MSDNSDNSRVSISSFLFRVMGTCIVLLIVSVILLNVVGYELHELLLFFVIIFSVGSGASLVAGIIAAIWDK